MQSKNAKLPNSGFGDEYVCHTQSTKLTQTFEVDDNYSLYIPCHRKYSQSEYRKAVATILFPTKFSKGIFYGMV